MRVYFLNDSKLLNARYRSTLMDLVTAEGYEVRSVGIYNVGELLQLAFGRRHAIVFSSNMRANLCNLLFIWRHGIVLFNGLGRLRGFKAFRVFILALVSINKRKRAIVQNYADYRYFKRCGISVDLVMGSGGVVRALADGVDRPFIVSRATKLSYSVPGASVIHKAAGLIRPLTVVGASSDDARELDLTDVEFAGVVDQSRIFKYGNQFLQPSGYGEGFPHSLADAIVSGLEIFMEKRTFVQLGLHKIGATWSEINTGVGALTGCEHLVSVLGLDAVNRQYFSKIKEVIQTGGGEANE